MPVKKAHPLISFIVISFMLAACAPAGSAIPEISTQPVQRTCQTSQILTSPNSFPEIRGTMQTDGELWALLFFDKATINQALKFVWRVTAVGKGPSFQIQAENEKGKKILPVWGPDFHESSTWKRPGVEYGTGFNFPEPGCWTITVTSGATIGKIVLEVFTP